MREVLENTDHLTIRQMEIAELIVEDGVLTGVKPFPVQFTTARLQCSVPVFPECAVHLR